MRTRDLVSLRGFDICHSFGQGNRRVTAAIRFDEFKYPRRTSFLQSNVGCQTCRVAGGTKGKHEKRVTEDRTHARQ